MAGCDQGHQHDQRSPGPFIQLVGQNVGPSAQLPADGVIRLAFDRLLDPYSVTRQSIVLRDSFGNAVTAPVVTYDPVARVVSLSAPTPNGAWLTPGQPYTVTLGVPNGDEDIGGLRAIDRATLDPAAQRVIGFQAAAALGTAPLDPTISFCTDVLPVFQAKCAASYCHGSPADTGAKSARFPDGKSRPAAGLVLDTSAGVSSSALVRAAQGSNTGPRAGAGAPAGHIFGVDMPVIDPGNPGHSWLMYKVLLAPPPDFDSGVQQAAKCDGTPVPTTPPFDVGPTAPLSSQERAVLSDYILGREMPYPTFPATGDPAPPEPGNPSLSLAELERLRAWIAQGAKVGTCGACVP